MVRVILTILMLINIEKEAYASFSLPSQFFGMKRITDEYRLPIKNKLLQLRQNFIEKTYKGGTRFTSNTDLICPLGTNVSALSPVVKYEYRTWTEKKGNIITSYEDRFLKGCDQTNSLVERFKTVGEREFITAEKSILQGEYDFEMSEGKNEFDYRLVDGFGVQVIRIFLKKTGTDHVMNFYLGNEKLVQIFYKQLKGKLDIRYKYFPLTFDMNRNGSVFRMSIPAKFDGFYRALVYDNGTIEYYNDKGIQISLASFQKTFRLNGVNYIMDSILIELPATQFVNSGNQSARLIEELRNAQTWLIQGGPAQINLVRNLVQEYLKAAESGLIVDKRPRGE